MVEKLNLNLSGTVFADELHADVGAAVFVLDHDWFTQQDLVIRTGAAGGGTLLVLNTDYQLSEESTDDVTKGIAGLSTRTAKTVYHKIQVINASYQTGNLYFSGKYIADSIDADDYNYLLSRMRPKGHLHGLTLSNGTDATNDIDIAAGEAVDNSDGELMVLASALTKQLDAAWAVGTNQGGRDTGAIADGWWAVWLIKRTDTGVVDVLFSLSASAPSMPTGYTKKRRIGRIIRVGGTILLFDQRDDRFMLRALVDDRPYVALTDTNRHTQTVTAPPNSVGIFEILSGGAGLAHFWVRSTSHTDAAASATNRTGHVNSTLEATEMEIEVDASSQIAYRGSSTAVTLQVETAGWLDTRERLA